MSLWLPLRAQKILDRLPAEIRSRGEAILEQADAKKRAALADQLARSHAKAARDFLLALVEQEQSAVVRRTVLDRLGRINDAAIVASLERRAASDPDPQVAITAYRRLRLRRTADLLALFENRLKMAEEAGDLEALKLLAEEQAYAITVAKGGMLPSFLQQPPPLFSLKPSGESIRVLAFGDFGQGTEFQKNTAKGMLKYHHTNPFDFAITLGDNFYSVGMDSPSDPRWKTWWEELYTPLGIEFYASLGNHDWGQPNSPAAEILYTSKSKSWRMPATHYTFTAGPAQFFALDTDAFSTSQLLWLRDQLAKSRAKWKVVYGHHPIYSHGQHGDTPKLIRDLLPVLKDRADVYICGHEHDLQHLKPEGGVHFFISGGGGARVRPIESGHRSLFSASSYGFSVLQADEKELLVRFVTPDQQILYEHKLSK
jgi:hypothetical protein